MVSCDGLSRCVRWKAANDKPIVPVPINVILVSVSFFDGPSMVSMVYDV